MPLIGHVRQHDLREECPANPADSVDFKTEDSLTGSGCSLECPSMPPPLGRSTGVQILVVRHLNRSNRIGWWCNDAHCSRDSFIVKDWSNRVLMLPFHATD